MGAGTLRPKRMEISVGDEGGTSQAPNIGMSGALTTKAAQRPSFMFNDEMDDNNKNKECNTPLDRDKIKMEITRSLTVVEERK